MLCVATDNNAITAIGLTMVAFPAMISGGMAFSLLTPVEITCGGITAVAGIGAGLFAFAEYYLFTHILTSLEKYFLMVLATSKMES